MKKTIEWIAKEYLFLDTLETRGRDALDFHDVAVWGIKKALETAYRAGAESVPVAEVIETGDKMVAGLGYTICGDENVFKKFRAAFNRMKKAKAP